MALDPTAMATFTIAEMRKGGSSLTIMELMGHAMAKYLCENTEVQFSWSGINSVPSSDPVTSYVTKDVKGDWTLKHTKTNNPGAAWRNLAEQIRKECGNFTIGPDPSWNVPRITFNNHTPPPLRPTKVNKQFDSFVKICAWILGMYKTYINPTPLMGSHGGYSAPSGSGAVMARIF